LVRKISIALAAIPIVIAAYLWASPYKTIVSISNGLLDGDPQALSRHVDFPALRQGLKDQSSAFILKEPAPGPQRNLLESLARMIGSRLMHQIIDKAVTPDGVVALAREVWEFSPEERERLNSPWRRVLAPFMRGRYGYDSLWTFSYRLPTEDGEIRLILDRRGLQWRMTNAVIPPDLLKRRIMKWVERK
jgi:hypothetical protein